MRFLLLAAVLAASSAQTAPRDNGTIEGTVRRHGTRDGLANVEIMLKPDADSDSRFPETVTDANGHFVVVHLSPGKYTIEARRGGYVAPPLDGSQPRKGAILTVVLAARQHVNDADLVLAPGAVIAGRVVDTLGKPVVRALVSATPSAVRQDGRAGGSVETNDRGEYRIIELAAGTYRVGVKFLLHTDVDDGMPPPFAETFVPRVTDRTQAVSLEVKEGAVLDLEDIVVTMRPPATASDLFR